MASLPGFSAAGTALGFGNNSIANQFQPEDEQARQKEARRNECRTGQYRPEAECRIRFGVGLLARRLGPLWRRPIASATISCSLMRSSLPSCAQNGPAFSARAVRAVASDIGPDACTSASARLRDCSIRD